MKHLAYLLVLGGLFFFAPLSQGQVNMIPASVPPTVAQAYNEQVQRFEMNPDYESFPHLEHENDPGGRWGVAYVNGAGYVVESFIYSAQGVYESGTTYAPDFFLLGDWIAQWLNNLPPSSPPPPPGGPTNPSHGQPDHVHGFNCDEDGYERLN